MRKEDIVAGNDFFDLLFNLTRLTRKPILVAEFSSGEGASGQKVRWIRDGLGNLKRDFPQVRGIIWWNLKNDPKCDWRIGSSQEARQAFQQAVSYPFLASNNYKDLSVSPIPPPGP